MESTLGVDTPANVETLPPNNLPSTTSTTGPTAKPLSCVSCRQRKVKCNKVHPCAQCQKSNLQCVFPNRVRVPRGKHSGSRARDSELLKRIARLESLVSKVDAAKLLMQEDHGKDEDGIARLDGPSEEVPSNAIPTNMSFTVQPQPSGDTSRYAAFVRRQEHGTRYISDDFWVRLGKEMDGLRQLLEHPSEAESDSDGVASPSSGSKQGASPNFIFGIPEPSDILETEPSESYRAVLYQYYFSNVHPVYHILHRPTIMDHMTSATDSDLIDPATKRFRFPSLEAMSSAIYFASVSSMSPEDCLEEFNEEKAVLQVKYKRKAERALAAADFLNSMEITTLQSFTIYVLALRSYSTSRTSWTLISLAVRIAHSLGLHNDGDGLNHSAFFSEMRRRLWWNILVQDMRASEDRGSEPVILEDSFNTRMPCNLNDEDFSMNSLHPLPDKKGPTEMNFTLITMYTSNSIRSLNFIPATNNRHILTLEQKEDKVRETSRQIETRFLEGLEPSNPSTSSVALIGRLLILKLWSVIQYPLQSRPEMPRPEFARGQGLRTVVAFLELSEIIEQSPSAKPFVWLFGTYVPWHPLAVALAELINNPYDALANKAWSIIDRNFDRWSNLVADSKDGMLWRPVKKLYKRAQTTRRANMELEQSMANIVSVVNTMPDLIPGMPALKLGEQNVISTYNSDIRGQDLMPSGQIPLPNLGFDGSSFPPMDIQPDLQVETFAGPINWDDWNEFIFDVGDIGSSAQPNFYEEWPMQT